MANKRTTELTLVNKLSSTDDILVNASGNTSRIPYSSFSGLLTDWSNINNKPFDKVDTNYFNIYTVNNEESVFRVLSLNSDKIKSDWSNLSNKPFTALNNEQFEVNSDVLSIKEYHTHSNISTLNQLSTSDNGQLLFNGEELNTNTEVQIDNKTIEKNNVGELSANPVVKMSGFDSSINSYANNKIFHKGELIVRAPMLYVCMADGVSGEWDNIKGSFFALYSDKSLNARIPYWDTNIYYTTNDVIIYDNKIWMCTTNHKSSEFSADISNWLVISGEKGEKGDNGVSPTVTITKTQNGAIISVTDINGVKDTELPFVTHDEFNTLYDMINSANTSLENTLNGGAING